MLDSSLSLQDLTTSSSETNFANLNTAIAESAYGLEAASFAGNSHLQELALNSNSELLDLYLSQTPEAVEEIESLGQLFDAEATDELTGIGEEIILADEFDSQTLLSSQNFTGSLDWTDEFDYSRFTYSDYYTVNWEGQLQIDLVSSEFDTYLQLFDAATGNRLAYDDDRGSGTNSQLTFTAQAGVNYLVQVTSYYQYETGQYTLTFADNQTVPPQEPNPPQEPLPPTNEFDYTYGYGLVDAASAVAEAIGQSPFSNVTDWGGFHWGNDMVNAPEVWDQGFTGEGVTVAVIDSGVDIYHPDLVDNIWTNTDEIANDGIDNDGNGYIDDFYGWNFGVGQHNKNVLPGTNDPGQAHGTHVAGTIAAANNGLDTTTGVAFDADIMALRLGDVSGNSFTNPGSLADAVLYAVDNGADVINLSLGWSVDPDLQNALAYAADNNVITVMAAGNDFQSSPDLLSSHATDYGIAVGSLDSSGAMSSFSNRAGLDESVHYVVAPGGDVYSTIPNDDYGNMSGTSMAAPHVAGVVALMLGANPNLTHAEVREILIGSSELASGSGSDPFNDTFTTFGVNDAQTIASSNISVARPTLPSLADDIPNTDPIVAPSAISESFTLADREPSLSVDSSNDPIGQDRQPSERDRLAPESETFFALTDDLYASNIQQDLDQSALYYSVV